MVYGIHIYIYIIVIIIIIIIIVIIIIYIYIIDKAGYEPTNIPGRTPPCS